MDSRKRILAIIEDKQGTAVEEVAEIISKTQRRVENDLQSLKDRGQVFEFDGQIRSTNVNKQS